MSRERRASLRDDPTIRKILVIKWSAMGDVVLASAAIEDISRAFPDCVIHLNTLPAWRELFRDDPRIARVLAIDVRRKGHRFSAAASWLSAVRAEGYDAVIDLQTTDRSRLLLSLLWLTGSSIRHRVGNRRCFPYTIGPPPTRGPAHALEIVRRTLDAAGIPATTDRPVLHAGSEDRLRVVRLMSKWGLEPQEFAVFLPGSQAAGWLKRWGAERYGRLARKLLAAGVPGIAILGGPDEVDECARIRDEVDDDRVVNLCGETTLIDVALICEGARFLVANDTGTAHLASATERPMVVICGPTDPRRVRPAGNNVSTLQARIPCINCYAKRCGHHSCMKMITPDRVMDALPIWRGRIRTRGARGR